MSNNNAIVPYGNASLKDLQEAAGVGQFFGTGGWAITISGFLIQGGTTSAVPTNGNLPILFNQGYPKQVLGIFLQSIYGTQSSGNENSGEVRSGTVTLQGFTILNDSIAKPFYWWAIGV